MVRWRDWFPLCRRRFTLMAGARATATLAAAGARIIATPVLTPWQSLNARLEGPASLQLTLFSDLPPSGTMP